MQTLLNYLQELDSYRHYLDSYTPVSIYDWTFNDCDKLLHRAV
jgi:hypothetical protein